MWRLRSSHSYPPRRTSGNTDGGLILVRELDERLGLGKLIGEHLSDSRQGTNKQFRFADLLRQSVYSRLTGYEDLNDAARVSADPTFRLIGSTKNWDRGGALTSRRQSFEAELLASEENLLGLMAVNRELVAQAEAQDDSERVVLDMDSTESPVHGQQEGCESNFTAGKLPPRNAVFCIFWGFRRLPAPVLPAGPRPQGNTGARTAPSPSASVTRVDSSGSRSRRAGFALSPFSGLWFSLCSL